MTKQVTVDEQRVVTKVEEAPETGERTPQAGPRPREAHRQNTVLARADQVSERRKAILREALERRRGRRQAEREAAIRKAAAEAGAFEDHIQQVKLVASEIVIPDEYQRQFSKEKGEGLAMRFNWRRFQAVQVNRRPDGSYALVDGQHRVYAAQRCFGPDVLIPANLTHVETTPEEAGDFDAVNTERTSLNYNASFRARVHARDERTLQVLLLLRERNLRPLWPGETRGTPGTVTACRTIEYQIVQGGASSARAVLGVLNEVGKDDPGWYRDFILGGVWQFLLRYDGYLKRERLVTVLSRLAGSDDLASLTQDHRSGVNGSAAVACAGALHYLYNDHMKLADSLPPYSVETGTRQTAIIKRYARRWRDQHESAKGAGTKAGLWAPGSQLPGRARKRDRSPS